MRVFQVKCDRCGRGIVAEQSDAERFLQDHECSPLPSRVEQ